MIYFLAGAATGVVTAASVGLLTKCDREVEGGVTVKTDTVMVRDTIMVSSPMASLIVKLPRRVERLPLAESINKAVDSAAVIIEPEQKVYAGDGWRAVVSGYQPSLDSMAIERSELTITRSHREPVSRWGVSVTAGVAATPRGFEPAIALGISYRIFSFCY